ncbi:MAG: YceI family protein [Planctomycetota bacterium]
MSWKILPLLFVATALCLVSFCGCYDPTADSADVGGGEAKDEHAVRVAESDATFALDADNCDIKWTGSNTLGMTPHGFFYELTGTVLVDGDSKDLKHFEVDIVMGSVKAMNEALTEKLKNHGFFEVEKFPKSTFVATDIQAVSDPDDEKHTHVIEGNFQLRDVTQSIRIPVSFVYDDEKKMVQLTSEFKLNRKDYGVIYSNATEDLAIRDDVLINIDIESETIAE